MVTGVAQASTDTAVITVTGTVKNNTCSIDNSAPSFVLPDVSVRDFNGKANTEISEVSIPVTFSNCGSDSTGISVVVSGINDSDLSSGHGFKNSGTADGVAVVLYDTDGYKFKTDGTSRGVAIKPNAGLASTTYKARYISTKENIKSGSVSTVITATFTYN